MLAGGLALFAAAQLAIVVVVALDPGTYTAAYSDTTTLTDHMATFLGTPSCQYTWASLRSACGPMYWPAKSTSKTCLLHVGCA